ncbi:MAG: peptidoglycan-binding protein [Clostridia bacterium]|nr:peptidoglycan-binding protein [Clostridia bacterium]
MNGKFDLSTIPAYITVHLGLPESDAENVTVSFLDYVKGVASANLQSGLPEEATKALIYAQISFALNRIQSGYYRKKGYPYDITNDQSVDQGYVFQGGIYEKLSKITDEIFTYYVAKTGSVEPLSLHICYVDGERCNGISLNESVDLALNGYDALQILQYFLGDDVYIEKNAELSGIETDRLLSYPLVIGDRGKSVSGLQIVLNRIASNYTAIPIFTDIDGIYDEKTSYAVSVFQRIFNMKTNGEVDRATYNRLSYVYDSIRKLSNLVNMGEELSDIPTILRAQLEYGSVGNAVKLLQYYLLFVSVFDQRIPPLEIVGVFGENTYQSVIAFQEIFGFEPNGIVNNELWNTLIDVYEGLYASLPPSAFSQTAVEYFGNILLLGSEGSEVRYLQQYLNVAAEKFEQLPKVVVNGYFDMQTERAVREFQKMFGIKESGVVSSTTWRVLAQIYNAIMGG